MEGPSSTSNNNTNASTTTTGARTDVSVLKGRLFAVLKQHSEEYWNTLRAFIAGRLTKHELDLVVHNLLGEDHISLHNNFIKSLIANAYSNATPPPRKRQHHDLSATAPNKRIKTRVGKPETTHSTTTIVGRPAIRPRGGPHVGSHPGGHPHHLHHGGAHHPHHPGMHAAAMHSFSGSPGLQALYNRMTKIAVGENNPANGAGGLMDVSGDAVRLMMFALERHMKDIIAKSLPSNVKRLQAPNTSLPRHQGALTLPPNSFRPLSRRQIIGNNLNNSIATSHVIGASHLFSAMQTRPFLMGEELPLNQERIMLLQDDASYHFPATGVP